MLNPVKGWFNGTMENGDHVQMGVECYSDYVDNEWVLSNWNYEDHTIASLWDDCKLVCKNLSGTKNQYKPIHADDAYFQCERPIPIFAFQKRNCNRNLLIEGEYYNECYKDWFELGLNLGAKSPQENYIDGGKKERDPKPVG